MNKVISNSSGVFCINNGKVVSFSNDEMAEKLKEYKKLKTKDIESINSYSAAIEDGHNKYQEAKDRKANPNINRLRELGI